MIPRLDVHVLELPDAGAASAIALLRGDPRVRYAQLDGVVRALQTPNDEFWSTQWSPVKTNAPQAWDLSSGSSKVVIAVVDTGVDPNQADLQGKLLPGYDYVNNDTNTDDPNGHGTGVAGIIAADSNNSIGVAGYCWECKLLPVRVLGPDGTGLDSNLAMGMVWATDHGARVINVSLGGLSEDLTVAAATQYAQQHGVLVVAAAGNNSGSIVDYPAALPNVISVGASDQSDRLYAFSNSGAKLAAPGENSTTAAGGGYQTFLGTSSAAPVVSGIAGLAFSAAPGATPAQVEQALEASAVPISGVTYGRVDAYGTVHAIAPALEATGPANERPAASSSPAASSRQSSNPQRRATAVFAGALTRSHHARTFSLTSDAGVLRATLTLRRRARTSVLLRLVRGSVSVVASARGRKVVRLQAGATQGTYRLIVSGRTIAPLFFRLVLSYARRP